MLSAGTRFAKTSHARDVEALVADGTLRATSLGFKPLEWSFSKDKSRLGGIDFHSAELLEFSIVAIPANPEALIHAGLGKSTTSHCRRRELELLRIRGERL